MLEIHTSKQTKNSIGVGLCLVQVLLIETYLLGACRIRLKSLLKIGTSTEDCNPHHVPRNIFSSTIYIQYRVCCKPWSPISILQRCKIKNLTTSILASTIIDIGVYRIGHVLHHGIVRFLQIVHIRSLFTVLAGDTYQGNPQKTLQPVQGHPLGTEITKKLYF